MSIKSKHITPMTSSSFSASIELKDVDGKPWAIQAAGHPFVYFAFNAKELDEETGMYYYEARYYNPPVFVSRDPHFERYFWTSPYGYCNNNPLKYVDPTGMDFDPVIDEENKTITIRAKYYTSKENIEDLQKGIDAWNNQSGKYQYVVGKGKNKEKYSIRFDLEIVACETNEDASHQYELDKSGMANYYDGRTYIGNNGDAQGITADGRSIRLNADANQISNVTRTMSHEIGHTLGISHWTQGLMKTGGTESWMSKDYVWQILSTSGFNPRFPNISWDGNMIDLSNDKNHINIWKSHVFTPKPITLQNGIVKSIWP